MIRPRPIHTIALEDPDQADVHALIAELDAYLTGLYPPESNHGIDVAGLVQAKALLVVARAEQGHAVGCGALLLSPDLGELKRIFVRPSCRGRGIGVAILGFLEMEAIRRRCTRLMLGTGIHQPESLLLYQRCGFTRCRPFGIYRPDPLSVFMCKTLGRSAQS
jgi:putative acetyltransferase